MTGFLSGVMAYLIGAFPTAYVFGRLFRGVDIRKVGSGNVGGMNTVKEAGVAAGLLTIAVDTGKGALAVYLAALVGGGAESMPAAALMAILGHNFNPFLGLKGGKGLATTLGAFLVLSPTALLFMLLLALVLAVVLRDANTAAGGTAALFPVLFWVLFQDWAWVIFGAALGLVIVIKHVKDFRAYARGRRKLF
ncbi:MAG: glycerol-3-phosphate acyltransferase [Bacillota bacterium]